MYFYKPQRGKWQLCIWDMDLGLGQYSDGPTTDIFTMRNGFGNLQSDPVTQKFFAHPPFRRAYLRGLEAAVSRVIPSVIPFIRNKHAAFLRNRISATSPTSLVTYLNTRSNHVRSRLIAHNAPFRVSTNLVFTTNEYAMVTGTASFKVTCLLCNGQKATVDWLNTTNWATTVRISGATNLFRIEGQGEDGQFIPDSAADVVVVNLGTPPGEPSVVINEWMAANTHTFADPADGQYDDWIELHIRTIETWTWEDTV
jgi:hypothetical protein